MNYMITLALTLILFSVEHVALAGSESMSDVLDNCDNKTSKTNFSLYVGCVKDLYNLDGFSPSDPSIKRFYYRLDELSARYRKKELSQSEAMSAVYEAYELFARASDREQHQENQEQVRLEEQQKRQQQMRARQQAQQAHEAFDIFYSEQQQQIKNRQNQQNEILRSLQQKPRIRTNCNSRWIGSQWVTDCN